MPHGGYHGTVVMGGNIIQQGDGQGGIQGGIDDRSRLDKNPPSGGSGSGSSSPPMGSGPHSDGILSVKPTESELAKEILFEPKPLDADSIKEGYIAGLNTFIPRKPNTTYFNDPAISVVNPEFVPLQFPNAYAASDKNYGKFAADAFTEGIASQLYNLYGDLGGRYNQFKRKGDFGVENIIELDPMLPFKPKPSQGFELFGKNISLPEMPLFGKPIKELSQSDLKKILDEVKKYKDGLPNYFEGFPGGLNIAKGMLDSISQGEEREDGSPTLQGLKKFIREIDPDSNMLDAFKQADPKTYLDVFGLPQTNAGLDFFANMGLTGDKTTDAKIIEARERLAQDRASGVMSAPSFATAPGQDAPPKPGPDTPDAPTGPSFTPQTTSPFDLSQFYAGLPSYSYGQQGVMNPNINPSLASYFENLKKYYGVG